jgi:hypothetical protein
MSLDDPNGIESSVSKNTKLRRTFLKRASATAVVGAIPAKSVWATGITNSIVASGHGSDFADGRDIELLSPCSILALLSANPDANLDLNFSQVFGEDPDQRFSEILSCHCGCPDETTRLLHSISNVVFYTDQGNQFKIDYDTDGFTDPGHPAGYYSYIESQGGGRVIDYVIKASGSDYDPTGAAASDSATTDPTWFTGYSGNNITIVPDDTSQYSSSSSTGDSCEGDDTTLAMIAIYLNARFDLYFRGGTATDNWNGSNGIYYPILSPTADVGNLVTSIKSSKNQLIDILTQYDAIDPPPSCP